MPSSQEEICNQKFRESNGFPMSEVNITNQIIAASPIEREEERERDRGEVIEFELRRSTTDFLSRLWRKDQ